MPEAPHAGSGTDPQFSVVIDRPAPDVFAFVTDMPRTPAWRTTVRQVDAVDWDRDERPVGRRFGAVTRVGGRDWRWTLEVTAWEPPHRFAYRVVDGVVPLEVAYRCEPSGDGCRFTMAASSGEPSGIGGKVLLRLMPKLMAREVRQHVANLKRLMEQEHNP